MKHNPVLQFLIVRVLHAMTARAMGVPFQPGRPALRAYAVFTQEQMGSISEADLPAVQERMYRAAHRMGSVIRKILFIRTNAQARRVLFWLYRNIGIEMDGVCPGTVNVRRCYFSRFYAPEMCRAMSAIDRGIFAGLFGGGELTFESRITEGCPCCRAVFAHERNEV